MKPKTNDDEHEDQNETDTQSFFIAMPSGFKEMDLLHRIQYVAGELKSLEAAYPHARGDRIRHTALSKIENGTLTYSVNYVPVVDNEY
jgi:hypothetical protein